MNLRLKQSAWRDAAALAAVFVLGATIQIVHMTSFFDGFDYSGFIDVFYRISSGQKLYADFFFNAGPFHPYIGGTLFRLFGPGTPALAADACLLTFVAAAASYSLARTGFGIALSLALSLLSVLFFVGPSSFPVYDHHAWMFYLPTLVLLRTKLSKTPTRDATLRGVCCGTLLALSFLSKANIGISAAIMVAVTLLLLPHRERSLPWFALSFLIAVNLVFVALGTPFEFINDNFLQYPAMSRLTQWPRLLFLLQETSHVPLALVAVAIATTGGRAFIAREKRDLSILAGIFATSLFSLWTSSMLPDLNGFLLGFEVLFLFLLTGRLPKTTNRVRRTVFALVGAVAFAMFVSGIERTGRWLYYSSRLPEVVSIDYKIKSPPLEGWACHRRACEGMDDAVEYLRTNVPKSDSVFVFPDMTVIYLLSGHESYRKAPFQFVFNEEPAPGAETVKFLGHFSQSPPKWIVLHDATYLPTLAVDTGLQLKALGLDEVLAKHYREVWNGKKAYRVLKRI